MTQAHSPEPWSYGDLLTDNDGEIIFDHGYYVGEGIDPSDEDWERIVACVNACVGIPTEELNEVAAGEKCFFTGAPPKGYRHTPKEIT